MKRFWRCSSLSSICWNYVLNRKCSLFRSLQTISNDKFHKIFDWSIIKPSIGTIRPKKVSSYWSQVGFEIIAVMYFLFVFCFEFCEQWYMLTCMHGYWNQTKFPIHKLWWLREAAQIRQTFITPMWKKLFKTQRGRIPINPAIVLLTALWWGQTWVRSRSWTHSRSEPQQTVVSPGWTPEDAWS